MTEENPMDTARRAYGGEGKPGTDMPQGGKVIEGMRPQDMAASGYKLSARGQEIKKAPANASLDNVLLKLPGDYGDLVAQPPTKQEMRFLSRDMQTLMMELEQADKGMQVIPGMEQNIKHIESQMDQAMADKKPDKYNNLELSLKNERKTLGSIQGKVEDTIRAAKAYHENNPQEIAKSRDMLKTLRTELSTPYSYSEAKDNLPTHTKPVVQWLDDLKVKGSLDDRMIAQNVLKSGNVDYKGILKERERQGLSLTDRAIAEQRDKEAGTASTEKPQEEHG